MNLKCPKELPLRVTSKVIWEIMQRSDIHPKLVLQLLLIMLISLNCV